MIQLRKNAKVKALCGTCEKPFLLRDHDYQHRMHLSKTGKIYCSNKCVIERLKKPNGKLGIINTYLEKVKK